ncbi:type II toxin-antitoxin system CcdA family antitoxin [Nonomuraea wenchangensis]
MRRADGVELWNRVVPLSRGGRARSLRRGRWTAGNRRRWPYLPVGAKHTISVTLDQELVEYARTQHGSLSAYVNEALAAKVREDRRRRAILQAHRDLAHAGADHGLVERRMGHVARQLAALSGEAE